MIIVISGSTHTGKTALSQKLMERYKIPYFSIDHLKMGLIRSGQTSLTVNDDKKLTPYLWSIAKEIIKTAIENRQNLKLIAPPLRQSHISNIVANRIYLFYNNIILKGGKILKCNILSLHPKI